MELGHDSKLPRRQVTKRGGRRYTIETKATCVCLAFVRKKKKKFITYFMKLHFEINIKPPKVLLFFNHLLPRFAISCSLSVLQESTGLKRIFLRDRSASRWPLEEN